MKKKVLVAIPERMLDQVDLLATYRCQTRSELIREALRAHLEITEIVARPAISLLPQPNRREEMLAAK